MILKGYMMKKITLEEKFELLKAYKEGKRVEAHDKVIDTWYAKNCDVWDFDDGQYRIRLDHTFKFKVNDVLVYKGDANKSSPNLYTVMNIDNNGYTLNGDEFEKSPSIIEKEYINKRDVLWFFEIYDYTRKKYIMHPTRMTIPEINEELRANHDTFSWQPIYTLGFKLKEN